MRVKSRLGHAAERGAQPCRTAVGGVIRQRTLRGHPDDVVRAVGGYRDDSVFQILGRAAIFQCRETCPRLASVRRITAGIGMRHVVEMTPKHTGNELRICRAPIERQADMKPGCDLRAV